MSTATEIVTGRPTRRRQRIRIASVLIALAILGVWIGRAGRVPGLPERATMKGPEEPIWGLAYSPDGSVLAVADYRGVTLRDPASGQVRKALSHPQSLASPPRFASIAFAPDGRTIVLAGWDGDATVWDVGSGGLLATLPETSRVFTLQFSPDGGTLALVRSGALAGGVEIGRWATTTWGEQARVAVPVKGAYSIRSAALSPDGTSLALASSEDGSAISLWDAATGRPRGVSGPSAEMRAPSNIVSIAFRPDGRSLATGRDDGSIVVWDLAEGRSRSHLRGHAAGVSPGNLQFTPDGRSLISAGSGWPPKSSFPMPRIPYFGLHRLVNPGATPSCLNQEFVVWEVDAGMRARVQLEEICRTLPSGTMSIGPSSAFAIAPDGRTLATSHGDGSVRLLDLRPSGK